MAKVKKELAGNWELTSGGVFHKSWAGVTFRSRGSAGAYFEGCVFPRPPEQPPPPPPPAVWTVELRVAGQYTLEFHANVKRFDEVRGTFTHHVWVIPDPEMYPPPGGISACMMGKDISFDTESLTVVWHIVGTDWFGDPYPLDIAVTVPPFNGGWETVGEAIDTQTHSTT